MHAISIPAPPPQFAVVILTTDPRTPEQYDGLVATQQKTAAASKGRGKAVATSESESDYGQFLSEDEQESEEDNNALHVLLHNRIPLDWVDHAYTYGVVYLEQQFHSPTMSLDIFREVDDERIEHLSRYGTPPAILQWDGWREMTEDNHYCLMFKHDEEHLMPDPPEAKGLYYYIGMDPNRVHL
ncbi:hypothetical protein C0995_011740 [Termitomyces sp. Mi166|nr:hypothetical protein C0995_011740 [Termitomyces sp. Mi166\